jgi:hypothetical protein
VSERGHSPRAIFSKPPPMRPMLLMRQSISDVLINIFQSEMACEIRIPIRIIFAIILRNKQLRASPHFFVFYFCVLIFVF